MSDPPSNLDSWSIPKRKPQPPPSQQAAPPMDLAIPKKKKIPSQHPGPPPSLSMSIPRRPSSSNYNNHGSGNSNNSHKTHRYSAAGGKSSLGPHNAHLQGHPNPNKHRQSLEGSMPRRKSALPFSGGSAGFNPSFDKMSIPRRSSFDRPSATAGPSSNGGSCTQPPRSSNMSIPRKKQAPLPTSHSRKPLPMVSSFQSSDVDPMPRPPRKGVQIVSDFPLIVKIPLRGVPRYEGIPRFRSSTRAPKRLRQSYKEVDDTDSDDFLTDSDEDGPDHGRPSKKKAKLKRFSKLSLSSSAAATKSVLGTMKPIANSAPPSSDVLALGSTSIEAPPPGTLSTLWYSREIFLNINVVEKVIAWRSRPVTQLEWVPETLPDEGPPPNSPALDLTQAAKWSSVALTHPLISADSARRMEISRLSPGRCPVIMAMACEAQQVDTKPRFHIKALDEKDKEEVYLVKWRGRSHMHASWERGADIIKFDQTNNTARHKLRRFVQAQELAFGMNWKKILEDERATSTAIHAHGEQTNSAESETVEEEYFPPSHIEVERILACDESEMDMSLFAKQRGLNVKNEQTRIKEKEAGTTVRWNSKKGLQALLEEIPWDPEDNVRYVVKWKGLPFAEMTWEYWRDIKSDAVQEAEDFWIRQQPPEPERVSQLLATAHPHIRDFRKIQESPVFGISKRLRKVADVGQAEDDEEGAANNGFRLRSYQLEGVNWLLFNWWNRRSCILADEMGLGKTIQSMCFIKSLQDLPTTDVRGPFLIVAPLSLIGQWQSEAQSWAPDLNVVLYHGSADARDFLVKQDFYYTDQFVPKPTAIKLKKQHITKFHILITTYEVVLKDVNVFSKIKWRALIVDEAHRLKNPKSRLFEDLGSVPRDFCLLLTGTPLANATEELWALLHFADKDAFADKDEFLDKFGELKDADQVNELHTVLKPFLLRRVKEDVEKSLPPKEETILEVSLTPIQKKFYKAIYERNTAFLHKGAKPNNAPSLMNVMMELRKCCNHPYLVRGAEERILADAASQIKIEKDADGNDIPIDQFKLFVDQLIKSSGKMVLINKLLPKLYLNGHKVLIFSQMVRVLDLLEELLKIMKYKYERLDGSTSSSSRAAAVDRFCRKSCQRFVMLLSTRAGGLGLNLTAADVVVIFDSDWNPQNDLQAMARAHRIGQTRAVRVYRLLTAKTYEMHMFHSASMKLGLERAVLSQQRDQGEDGESGKTKSKSDKAAQAKEIDSLLKKGAYDVFKEEDDDEAQKFMETDIDQLLESNAQTVTYGKDDSNMSSGLGSFSKASFVADTGDGEKDVDLDDPDFWKKAAGLEAPIETPEEVAQMLDDGVKRSRKQVQVFDPFADFAEIEQRKEDKKMQKIREEKEEKERQRVERKVQKIMEKEKKKKETDVMRGNLFGKAKLPISRTNPDVKFKLKRKERLSLPISKKIPKEKFSREKMQKEAKAKKPKKSAEKRRAFRRAQNEDPAIERLRQAWDVSQRNRAIAAFLRFGFGRFCKVRSEANLTSLPIQDLEIFFRAFFFQLTLQLAVTFSKMIEDERSPFSDTTIQGFMVECLGAPDGAELSWVSECVSNGMRCFLNLQSKRCLLRMPMVLAEGSYIADLRRGSALRSLRRIFAMNRVARIVEDSVDQVLYELGYEQLAKRGCPTSDFASLDIDLKTRLVSAEELSLSISSILKKVDVRQPVAWWDRSCDIALLIGSFVHGLGNYDAMESDENLPFYSRIQQFARSDEACASAQSRFYSAAKATLKVFSDALDAAKMKDQLQIQAAVAAAAAASMKREKDALALREGGDVSEAVTEAVNETAADKLYEIDGDDSHFVTLTRLKKQLLGVLLSLNQSQGSAEMASMSVVVENPDQRPVEEKSRKRRGDVKLALGMPDARILDYRLNAILSALEKNSYGEVSPLNHADLHKECPIWPCSEDVSVTNRIKTIAEELTFDDNQEQCHFEQMGIGLHATQCGSPHRSLDDGSDYFIGAATVDLAQVAHGSDAPRYLRAIGVPMNMTRFAVSAMAYADERTIHALQESERNMNSLTSNQEADDLNEKYLKNDSESNGDRTPTPSEQASAGDSGDGEKDSPPVAQKDVIAKPETNENLSKAETVSDGRDFIPQVFRENATLRASVSVVVLNYGFPFEQEKRPVCLKLWKSIREQCVVFDDVEPDDLFAPSHFVSLVRKIGGENLTVPDFSDITKFVVDGLLPHCLRLCLMGNGPSIDNARGSKGEYETAYGISLYPEPTERLQCDLPDPCLSLEEHSMQALASAHAILRRSQMMRCALHLASGKLPVESLESIARSSFMRKSMSGLPVWWCPWIHDLALLVHVATKGLFSVFKDREVEGTAPLAFSTKMITQHLRSTFIADDSSLPRSVLGWETEEAESWVEHHAKNFPSRNVLERRIAFLCAQASEQLDARDRRYDNLPMFDHGAWPRN